MSLLLFPKIGLQKMQLIFIQQQSSANDLRTLSFASLAALLSTVAAFAAVEPGAAIESFAAIPPRSLIQAAIRI
jgi:hypothetical protein